MELGLAVAAIEKQNKKVMLVGNFLSLLTLLIYNILLLKCMTPEVENLNEHMGNQVIFK